MLTTWVGTAMKWACPHYTVSFLHVVFSLALNPRFSSPGTGSVMHGLLVHFLVLCGDRTAYCTDMGSCECGFPFLEPFEFPLVSMHTSDGGLPIR